MQPFEEPEPNRLIKIIYPTRPNPKTDRLIKSFAAPCQQFAGLTFGPSMVTIINLFVNHSWLPASSLLA